MGLTIEEITRVNTERCRRWHGEFPDHSGDDWIGADWSNAMCGEAGETANVVKKLRRLQIGTQGNQGDEKKELVLIGKLADEIADTFLYLNLLATFYGIDMEKAIVSKFNEVSERESFPEMLSDDDSVRVNLDSLPLRATKVASMYFQKAIDSWSESGALAESKKERQQAKGAIKALRAAQAALVGEEAQEPAAHDWQEDGYPEEM